MKRLNNKGYMLVEVIVSSMIALVIAYFLIDITVKLVNKNNDYYLESILLADKNIVTKEIMDDINSMKLTGVNCQSNTSCILTFDYNDENKKALSINDKTISYGDYSKTFSDEVNLSQINIKSEENILTISIDAYTNYSKENYGINIIVPSDPNELEITLPPIPTHERLGLTISEGTPDFSKSSCSSGCDEATVGIYAAEDDLGTSYYFRGDVENNYVKFGKFVKNFGYREDDEDNYQYVSVSTDEIATAGEDMYFRIIRINGDGTIRMIYDGTSARNNGSTTGGDLSTWNFDGEDTSSARSVINTWYQSNILGTYDEYINQNVTFCNDTRRSTSSTEINGNRGDCSEEKKETSTKNLTDTYYYPYIMKKNSSPSLICSSNEYLSSYENANVGNKNLKYPVDFISAEEIIMAGGSGSGNVKYYLYNSKNVWANASYMVNWQHKPVDKGGTWVACEGNTYYLQGIASDDGIYGGSDEENWGSVKPVISLRADLDFTGTGTMTDPFIPVLP